MAGNGKRTAHRERKPRGDARAAAEWRPGDLGRATLAAAIGGVVGVVLVADPSLSGGVHGP